MNWTYISFFYLRTTYKNSAFFLNSAEYCSTILAASSILLVLQGKRNFQSFTLTTITSNKERIQFHCLPSKKEKTSFGLPHSHSVKKKEHAKQFDIHFTKIKKKGLKMK